MPRGDRTGPTGAGSRTGRAAGYCAGYSVPGYMNPAFGRGGAGFGAGRGRGWRNWYNATGMPGWMRAGMGYPSAYTPPAVPTYPPTTPPYLTQPSRELEMEALKEQVKYMEDGMTAARERIAELEKAQENE